MLKPSPSHGTPSLHNDDDDDVTQIIQLEEHPRTSTTSNKAMPRVFRSHDK